MALLLFSMDVTAYTTWDSVGLGRSSEGKIINKCLVYLNTCW